MFLNRTFSPFQGRGDLSEEDYGFWFQWLASRKGGLSWNDLIKKRLVIVLGETGIGKTFEFQNQAMRLQQENEPAFFLALNQLVTRDAVALALHEHGSRYEQWLSSTAKGYFFLDAVDEARLNRTTALQTALRLIRDALQPCLNRVSFFISSRISDWSLIAVSETVKNALLNPLRDAEASSSGTIQTDDQTLKVSARDSSSSIDLTVVYLDPLSEHDAKLLAELHGAKPAEAFWEAVEEGSYEFMATRPLDLEWMAKRWASAKTLGKYSELIEAAITFRLRETNQNYIDSGAVLSSDMLRQGAEQLAAACIFSSRPYIAIASDASAETTISPDEVLPGWTAQEQFRLLATAVFDHATYGRVKFHHRAVREYLAACWVERRLKEGLPISHALELFIQAPYEQPVLINSRRSVLCWLASFSVTVREHVIRQFPEMLMFEGDPERWSTDDVVLAFDGFVRKLEKGYWQNWRSYSSELRRVARMLPAVRIAEYVSRYSSSTEVLYYLLSLIRHAKVSSCEETVFALYKDTALEERFRRMAIISLTPIVTMTHRTAIVGDLVSGKLQSNKLISAALKLVGLDYLTGEQITEVLRHTDRESEYGDGPMSIVIKDELLPNLGFNLVLTLITSILAVVATLNVEQASNLHRLKEGWMLALLPDCLLRALKLLTGDGAEEPQELVDASVLVERLQHTTYTNDKDLHLLRLEIEKHPAFRRRVILAIAYSEDVKDADTKSVWASHLVSFKKEELDWLVQEANRQYSDDTERRVWYQLACELAIFQNKGKRRRQALSALISGPNRETRRAEITALTAQRAQGLRQGRSWRKRNRERNAQERRQLAEKKVKLLKSIDSIRNGTGLGAIIDLIAHAAQRGSFSSYTKVRLDPITKDFGSELSEALDEGLEHAWRRIEIPNPTKYADNRVPWGGLVGLASINHSVSNGLNVEGLAHEDVTRAVQFCVWDFDKPEPWLDTVAQVHKDIAVNALMPWFEFELETEANDNRIHHTLELILRAPKLLQQPFLDRAIAMIKDGNVSAKHVQFKIIRALKAAGVGCGELIETLAKNHLAEGVNAETPTFVSDWFQAWAAADFPRAWSWLETNGTLVAENTADLARLVAPALDDSDWAVNLSGTEDEVNALISLFRFLTPHVRAESATDDEGQESSPQQELEHLRNSIAGILAKLKSKFAHIALNNIASENVGTPLGAWLEGFIRDHASAEAESRSVVFPRDLPNIGEVYCREPRNERELFTQVLARLEAIREGVERGPFSDRVLFTPGMDEKNLQLWLASRLSDTPLRHFIARYVVHREPVVDSDNRTDIEVSSACGKVCVELKPLDSSRPYSASSLLDTLTTQLGGQYLRGRNSKNGILILFRLDSKKWEIPGRAGRADFDELLGYLKKEATAIEARDADIDSLTVIGIDCVPP